MDPARSVGGGKTDVKRRMNVYDRIVTAALLGVLLMLPACGGDGEVSKDSYDQIREGMTLEEIEAVLGKGTQQPPGPEYQGVEGEITTYRWEDNGKSITATFVDGRADAIARSGF